MKSAQCEQCRDFCGIKKYFLLQFRKIILRVQAGAISLSESSGFFLQLTKTWFPTKINKTQLLNLMRSVVKPP